MDIYNRNINISNTVDDYCFETCIPNTRTMDLIRSRIEIAVNVAFRKMI